MKKWLPIVLTCTVSFPAFAQAGFLPAVPAPALPETPPTPVPAMDLAKWQQSLENAKSAAEKAALNGDTKTRDAALQDAASWANKIFEPAGVSEIDRIKALQVIGGLAQEMVGWNATFGDTKLVMVDVRGKSLVDSLQGATKAHLLKYLADLQVTQGYSSQAFEYFKKILDVPEADPVLIKDVIIAALPLTPAIDKVAAKPFYARMLILPLTPAEQADWKLRQQLFALDTEGTGPDHEAAMTAVKAILDDPKTSATQRNDLGMVYGNHIYGDARKAFVEQMIDAFEASPALKAQWIHRRGMDKAADKDWPGAVADYRAAAKLAPVGTPDHDQFVFDAATVAMQNAGEKTALDKTAVEGELSSLLDSKTLSLDQRFEAAFRLFVLAYGEKKFVVATSRIQAARKIAGDDALLAAKANVYLARVQNELGETEAAVAVWKAIPLDKITYAGPVAVRRNVQADMKPVGIELYSAAAAAKKFELAQAVLDYSRANVIFDDADQRLLEVDILARQGKYDEAITALKKLAALVTSDNDKKMIAEGIANLEKQKADAEKAAGKPQ